INNSAFNQYTSPIFENENSPENESPLHQEFSFFDMEYTSKDIGNLKEYIYYVSILNQNFSFKDFAILKITDDTIQLAITPKENQEKYSKYYFDPEKSILDIGEEALKVIFKETRSVKFLIDHHDSSEEVLNEKSFKPKDIMNKKENNNESSSPNDNYSSSDNSSYRLSSPNSIKTEHSDTYSYTQSDHSKKTSDDSEFENLSNEISNENISSGSSFSLLNSNDSINKNKWMIENLGKPYDLIELLESLNSTKEKNTILQKKIENMKQTSDSNVNEIRLLHMRLENDKKLLKSLINTFSENEEKAKDQPKSYKNLLLIVVSNIVLIIAFLYIK
ncbi:hypothetical protein BCR36DRAFT_305622, partial [Piromyces finnis]